MLTVRYFLIWPWQDCWRVVKALADTSTALTQIHGRMHQTDSHWCFTCSDFTVTSCLYIHWSVPVSLCLSYTCALSLAVWRCTLSAQEEQSFMALTAQSGVSLETKPSAVAAHGNWGPVESSIRAKMAAWLFVCSLRTAGDMSGVKATGERVHWGMKEDLMLESVWEWVC